MFWCVKNILLTTDLWTHGIPVNNHAGQPVVWLTVIKIDWIHLNWQTLEAFLGANIKESDVDFNIDRKLTQEEIEETIIYCRNDVEQTINVFLHKVDDFNAMHDIVKAFKLPLTCLGDSEAQITAKVLGCERREYTDEFDYYYF